VKAWLRQLLLNNLADFTRLYRATDKRQVGREVMLNAGNSSTTPRGEPAGDTPTPSAQAMEQEQARAIQQALERLPDDYRLVLRYRYEEERSFEDIGRLMNLSPNAARNLWLRAIKRLRKESEGSS